MAAPPAARLGWAQVAAWRAARHHLDERAPAGAELERLNQAEAERLAAFSGAELELRWAEPAPGAAATG
jgi:hypothetical protein